MESGQTHQRSTLPSEPSQPITPLTPVMTPQSNPSKLPTILITLVSLLSLCGLTYFYLQTQLLKQQLAVQPTPPATISDLTKSQPIPTTDPTANWKIYTHPTQKYQLKLPAAWSVVINKNADAETLFGPNATSEQGEGGVEVREIPILDPKNYLDHNIVEVVEQKELTLPSGIHGYRTIFRSMLSGISFAFKSEDGLLYNIYLNANTPSELDTKTFDGIISTFQFTDSQ